MPATGTYFIRVNESGNDSTGTYRLFVAAPAQTKRWTGASDPNWGSALNWNPAILHPGDAPVFPSNASFFGSTNNFTAGTAFDGITFTAESANNGNYALEGNRVVLSNGVTNNTASPQTLTLPIDFASDQTFQNTQAAGTMLFTGQIQTGTRTLTVTGPGPMTINDLAATLAAPGTAALIKNGLGELALPSAVNVNGRVLQLNGGTMTVNAITPGTPVTISGGTLGGAGTVGNVTASGGAITPGNSAGVLNTGNLSLNSSTSIAFELDGTTVGMQYDQINVTGAVTLNNAGFGPVFNFVPPVGTAFMVIQNDEAEPVTGTFNFLPEGKNFSDGARLYQISYIGGTGNDVVFTRLPDPSISINDASIAENNFPLTKALFTVTLSAAVPMTVTVNYATADGTATAPADYTAISGQVTFAPGDTTQVIVVPVVGDTVFEANETFTVNLSGTVSGTIGDAQGIGTITNDDLAPSLSINDVSVTEGNSGNTNAIFTVTLAPASGAPASVDYTVSNGTAASPADYIAGLGQLTFATGETTKTISVPVVGDTLFELNETFLVNLSNGVSATIGDAQGIGTITNDEATPALSITDVTVTEGNSGTTTATFTVATSVLSSQVITVNFTTTNGTATAPGDYTTTSGQLTFAPTVANMSIPVPIVGDLVFEPNETFTVDLSNPVNASIADGQGLGTITNDDPAPSLSINDVTVTEGTGGTTNATFTVTLSPASVVAATVNFATADSTATAPGDYTTTNGQVTFAPSETTKTITVPVVGDAVFEPNETFTVNLSNPANATIADAQGVGTITNDEATPTLAVNDVTVAEGNSGTSSASFTVTLSVANASAVTVNYATADGTATAPGDYTATSGQLTFAAQQTTQTVTVPIVGDTVFEPNETFTVNLSNPANATMADGQGLGTITNDDAAPPTPTLSINDVTVAEGNSGTSNATFTVTLSAASASSVTVNYATADGTATAAGDYTATSGQLTFAAQQTTQTVTVPIVGDTVVEPNETFTVNLSGAPNATIADAQGVGTITNDDTAAATSSLTINDVTVTEGDSGTTNATFTVTLAPATASIVTVNFATADGTATAPGDYAASSGQLTFAAQQTTQTITVPVAGDTVFEPNETFTVNLNGVVNATIGDGSGIGTITNDDVAPPTPSLTINDVTLVEGNTGTSSATFTVTLAPASASVVTVNFATAGGTATAPGDYTATSGQLTFAAQETTKTITVPVVGDTVVEPTESFTVNLTGAVNATIADSQGVGTITNDDSAPATPTVTITSPTGNPTTTGTSPFLTIGGTTASADVADGGPALSTIEGSEVEGPRAGSVTSVTCASNRGFSGTATGTTTWQCDVPLQAGVNVISVSATDAGGQIGTDIISVTVTNFIYYLAEGATGPFFDLELALANPTATAAPVNILFLKGDGTTVPVNLTVPAQSRASVLVDDLPGLAETDVSAIVTSVDAITLAVERTMRWNTQGYGSHTEKATAGAHTTRLFAEGSEQAIFDTYLLLANPQPTANRATVTFLVENGAPVVKIYDLLPTSRTNVFAEVIPELKEKSFGMAVSFDQPGVAERAMYFGTSVFWDGGHESAGVNEASTSWFHAEGATGPFFDTFILLSNPNAAPATVTLTFLLDTGETVVKTKVVPANARLTVIVEGEDAKLANAAMATQVTSTLPIVSERAMYWAQYPNWYEAHNSFGVTSTGTKWALGEGRVGGAFGFETYILLANPGATAANVTVTFLREAGLAPITRTYDVNATSRFNVYANAADIGLTSGERYGVLIVSSVPIAVERAMYSNSPLQPGVVWAAGTNASATKIP